MERSVVSVTVSSISVTTFHCLPLHDNNTEKMTAQRKILNTTLLRRTPSGQIAEFLIAF